MKSTTETPRTPYRGLNPRPEAPNFWRQGIVVSIALHLFFIGTLFYQPAHTKAPPKAFSVQMVPESLLTEAAKLQKRPAQQIVSPSTQKAASSPPDKARLLSDRATRAAEEQILRGDGLESGKLTDSPGGQPQAPPRTPAAPEAVKPSTTQEQERRDPPSPPPTRRPAKALPKRSSRSRLDLGPATQTLKSISSTAARSTTPQTGPPSSSRLTAGTAPTTRPFSRRAGSSARFHGRFGNADHLPGIKDGDITLLNAKASKFAVFVRRVAVRVFQQVKADGWTRLAAPDIARIEGYALVRAVMSPEGDLQTVRIEKRSGSPRFDRMLESAVQESAADPHPPEAAIAGDGNIHFLFLARSWVQRAADPRNPGFGERRWLILQTGLE